MKSPEEIFQSLKAMFGDSVVELKKDQPVESFIIINPLMIDKICLFLRDNEDLLFDSLMNLSGVDDANGQSVNDEEGGLKILGG
ncbi:MAG TPA: hypothetical protein VLM39_08880, partial [Ignavibacteriaceae bacterium]|nr:hypothetical protein [Ignavibacteriaceae bacterium]